jgi:hypothetical protein
MEKEQKEELFQNRVERLNLSSDNLLEMYRTM